jgi:hypothetical protein
MRPFAVHMVVPTLIAVASASAQQPKLTREIAATATPATITVITLDSRGDTIGQGSGFFVRQNGVFVTNWHVMRGATRAVVVRPNGERFERVSFIDGDSAIDVAILKVPGFGLPVLDVRSDSPPVGTRVVAIGSPLGLTTTVSEGIVSATRIVNGRELIQTTAAISPGSSGGALLDETGRVFAVSTLYLEGGQQLNFAIPVRYAMGYVTDSPRERAIADVFGNEKASASDHGVGASRGGDLSRAVPRTDVRASGQPFLPLPTPKATRTPLKSLAGVWTIVRETFYDSVRTRVRRDGILIAFENVGWMVLGQVKRTQADTATGDVAVWPVSALRTTSSGEVVLDAATQVYDGVQTNDGFSARASGRGTDGVHYGVLLVATRSSLPASYNSGIFSLSARTFWHPNSGDQASTALPWTGVGAVVAVNDSVFVDFQFSNASGGTTAFWGKSSMMPSGEFDVTAVSGSRIVGTLRAGVLTAEWTDLRKEGSFRGLLRAERQ